MLLRSIIFFLLACSNGILSAQSYEELLIESFDPKFIRSHNIVKLEEDYYDEARIATSSSYFFNIEGLLERWEIEQNSTLIMKAEWVYDRKNRIKKYSSQEGSVLVKKLYDHSEGGYYSSTLVTDRKKVIRLVTGDYTFKQEETFVETDSLGKIAKSLTYRYLRGFEGPSEEESLLYAHYPDSVTIKGLRVDNVHRKKSLVDSTILISQQGEDGFSCVAIVGNGSYGHLEFRYLETGMEVYHGSHRHVLWWTKED